MNALNKPYTLELFRPQNDADGIPRGRLVRDSLETCEKIGSNATTIEEAREDPKARTM